MTGFFSGTATAMITPFGADGGVNFNSFGEMIERQITAGTDMLVILGTTGEPATMTEEEKISVMEYSVKKAKGRIKIVFGCGSNCTEHAVSAAKQAEAIGADGLLAVTPYYNKCTQNGLYAYYKSICEAVKIPVIAYNVPSRTGTNIACETYKVLSAHKNIVAVKEANGDISSVAHTVSLCGDSLDIYSGNDDQVIPMISLGGKGVISVFSNFAPKTMSEITGLALEGKFKEATALQSKYLELMNSMFIDVNPIPVKEAMNLLGYNVGPCRLPLCSTTPEKLEKIKAALKGVNLL